ncbi:LCP family protein [Streptomyces hoynatensis]|uniref:LytR family transcriptional regulator n=1 Tax=Streptomyces hoynatensis TaxID=1141874 RepID=A0A3A9YYW8_9ACTN|nr:LCP family protein [Streptomyces hoynatensis]RKN40929.1 LytR family transcriptional regulator [Streptomyces hoynatensis]
MSAQSDEHGDERAVRAGRTPPAGVRGRAGRRARTRRGRLLRALVYALASVVLVAGAGLTALYVKLDGNISAIDLDAALGTGRPADSPGGSVDILVLGSDSRAGEHGAYGRQRGARADTSMIVHLNEARDAATVVSLPRDTLVRRPACERADGGGRSRAAARAMFNSAYSVGGPVCAVKTVEKLTGLRMDHFVEVDFDGFAKLVDTLGGVEVTTRQRIEDPDSRLDLPAGTHTLDGEQSLALVRTRKAVGDGSDLGRIRLQQDFVRALADRVGGLDLLTDPKRLFDLADTATSALTTDSDLASVPRLASLARDLHGLDGDDLRMLTLPVAYDRDDPNRVVPRERQADRVWRALREDRQVPRSALRDSAAEKGGDEGLLARERAE